MKHVVDWLSGLENRAYRVYSLAARRFRKEPAITDFLEDLAADEFCHVQFMNMAADYVDRFPDTQNPVALDEATKAQLEAPFDRTEKALQLDTATPGQLLDCIVDSEFSEWNDLLVFVTGRLQKRDTTFMRMAAAIDQHRRFIKEFVTDLPGGRERLEPFEGLPRVWQEQILVVDDTPAVANLLAAVCRDFGNVVIASNGAEALARIRESYFDVIISDIQMPVLDGVEFYRRARAEDPCIGERLLFFSGLVAGTEMDFLKENQLRHIEKPAAVADIKQEVCDILRAALARKRMPGVPGAARLNCTEAALVLDRASWRGGPAAV